MPRRGRYGAVDRHNPEAVGFCDRGGEARRLSELLPEMHWAGNRLVPTGFRVCAAHMDQPHPQDRTLLLPPDPEPARDPMPDPDAAFYAAVGGGPGRLDIDFVLDLSGAV